MATLGSDPSAVAGPAKENALANGKQSFKAGDICTFRRAKGTWSFFWILKIDHEKIGDVYSLRKFGVDTASEVTKNDTDDIEELKTLPLLGHFPIAEDSLLACNPRVIGYMPVHDDALEGYTIWKEAFDQGRAGVFTLPVEEI